ncbi:hypothetical protein [Coleofasciculus sp. F4-SAH-05]|uniref:hypothetical protein n=1 Tax=Coleofasciculus sp. F4-SAH-05 TaxID=3069525 RepID=UPI0032FFE331
MHDYQYVVAQGLCPKLDVWWVVIRHSSFVIRHLSFVIRHSSFVILAFIEKQATSPVRF